MLHHVSWIFQTWLSYYILENMQIKFLQNELSMKQGYSRINLGHDYSFDLKFKVQTSTIDIIKFIIHSK